MTVPFSLPTWTLTIRWWCYLLQCAVGTLVVRLVFYTFRAMAVTRGDFPDSDTEPGKNWTFRHAYWECFNGFSPNKAHADLWLSALVGFAELAAYPVFLKLGYLSAIGGWLALKVAGGWNGWKISRTSFHRFLLSNLIELTFAYFWLIRYVQVK